MAAADNNMLWASWGVTQLHERVVKFNNNIVRGKIRNALLGDVVNVDQDRGKGQAIFEDHLYSRVLVRDGEWSKSFDDLVKTHYGPCIDDIANMLEQVIGDKDNVIFGKMDVPPEAIGARSFVATYDNISLRVTSQYDSYSQGMQVTFDILVATYDTVETEPIRETDIVSGKRAPDKEVIREAGRVDAAGHSYNAKPTSDAEWDYKSGKWLTPKSGDITISQAELNKMLADARKSGSVKEVYAKGAEIAKAIQKEVKRGRYYDAGDPNK